MAVYNLEEQEQIDELKSWWHQHGNLVLLAVFALTATIAGIQGWRYYQNKQAVEAGELYVQLQGAVGGGDARKTQDIAVVMTEKYPRTGYAVFAALAGAKAAFESGDMAAARNRLQWVIDNGRDDETRDLARLRLAATLLDAKQYDESLKLLAAKHTETMTALYADLKGDVLVAQGKIVDARGAYQLALDKSDAKSAHRALVQIKLDALGATK